MGIYQSQAAVFTQYAAAQVTYGQRLVATHLADGIGCCRRCGRTWPCDDVENGRQLIAHYQQWADIDGPDDSSQLATP